MRNALLILFVFITTFCFGQGMRCPQCPPSPVGNAGKVLGTDGTFLEWITAGSSGAGGNTGQVQFNSGGAFAGDSSFRYHYDSGDGVVILDVGSADTAGIISSQVVAVRAIGDATFVTMLKAAGGANYSFYLPADAPTNCDSMVLVFNSDNSTYWTCLDSINTEPVIDTSGFWNLHGNAGTDSGVHYIGTSDLMPLRFKINNTYGGLIDFSNTTFGFHTLMFNSGANNTAMGVSALHFNTTGMRNLGIGESASRVNTTGSDNVAIGVFALRNDTTGSKNTVVGSQAMDSCRGSNNTAIGYRANTSLNTVHGSTAIGINATVTASRQLAISDSCETLYMALNTNVTPCVNCVLTNTSGAGAASWQQLYSQGTYLPVDSGVSNTASITVDSIRYIRIGNEVFMQGSIVVDPTAAVATVWEITLPIASNFTVAYDGGGNFGSPDKAGEGGGIRVNPSTDKILFQTLPLAVLSATTYSFNIQYRVK